MADVFISYGRADQPSAARIAKALERAGLRVWWDADLPAHRSYSEVIERNLEQAGAVVVLWSQSAAKSQWVRAEADFARNAGKLVQATVDGSMPPLPFNQVQCADLQGWRSSKSHPGWSKLSASINALLSGEDLPPSRILDPPSRWRHLKRYRLAAAAAAALIAIALISFFYLAPPRESRKPVLAVLPFRTINAQDESLVAGLWEDTRQAIGRNPQLVVLGPKSAQRLADKGEGAARHAADYLLEASVRSAGDRIRVSADLVRTKDGQQVWTQDFDRKLDDVFVLQSEIATAIEGRIRGRLARNGGIRPEHIATTGDVYALYADARAKVRKRDASNWPLVVAELNRVVQLDPNYAPGWATLAEAQELWTGTRASDRQSPARASARKAIELAPNLATGHAALALALNLQGPIARAEVEKAAALDPNDFEAATWLGNMRNKDGDLKGAVEAYKRSIAIEPFFYPGLLNLFNTLRDAGDRKGILDLIDEEKQRGADECATALIVVGATTDGDLAKAVNVGLRGWLRSSPEGRSFLQQTLFDALFQLQFEEEARKIGVAPAYAAYIWRNDPKGLQLVPRTRLEPAALFMMSPLAENVSRLLVLENRSGELADKYLSLKMPVDQFAGLIEVEEFLYSAPIIAVALQRSGHQKDAKAILEFAENAAKTYAPSGKLLGSVLLGRVLAAEGRKEDALRLLAGAINRGWIPITISLQADLHNDPPLDSLRGDPRFEKLRSQLLGTIARERAQVDTNLIRQAEAARQ